MVLYGYLAVYIAGFARIRRQQGGADGLVSGFRDALSVSKS